jgi:hypothetical protein
MRYKALTMVCGLAKKFDVVPLFFSFKLAYGDTSTWKAGSRSASEEYHLCTILRSPKQDNLGALATRTHVNLSLL